MASHPIYQLYLELEDYEPKIWRRIQLMSNIKFSRIYSDCYEYQLVPTKQSMKILERKYKLNK